MSNLVETCIQPETVHFGFPNVPIDSFSSCFKFTFYYCKHFNLNWTWNQSKANLVDIIMILGNVTQKYSHNDSLIVIDFICHPTKEFYRKKKFCLDVSFIKYLFASCDKQFSLEWLIKLKNIHLSNETEKFHFVSSLE